MLGLHSTATAINNGGKVWCEDDKRKFANLGKHSSSCWIKPHKFKPWCSGKFVVLRFHEIFQVSHPPAGGIFGNAINSSWLNQFRKKWCYYDIDGRNRKCGI